MYISWLASECLLLDCCFCLWDTSQCQSEERPTILVEISIKRSLVITSEAVARSLRSFCLGGWLALFFLPHPLNFYGRKSSKSDERQSSRNGFFKPLISAVFGIFKDSSLCGQHFEFSRKKTVKTEKTKGQFFWWWILLVNFIFRLKRNDTTHL